MLKNFVKAIGPVNVLMLLLVISIIIVAEITFINGQKLEAIFIGLWAPTILGFMNYLKRPK
ncbi:hypothetical protein [Muriicola sp. Z0-33]|uniref:hypothetical protein n=1 Tax=Muriicola sp. Z0-33 TaxID=2816957 RepID=UPI002238BAB3|nr:hypothetical protein [Muriicola sp. Z0-33]MCW5514764.1 hypothetical protein [Muriicola sp. Z0-33]